MPGPQETTEGADFILRIRVPYIASHGYQDGVGVKIIEDVGDVGGVGVLREDKAGREEEKQGNTEQHCGR